MLPTYLPAKGDPNKKQANPPHGTLGRWKNWRKAPWTIGQGRGLKSVSLSPRVGNQVCALWRNLNGETLDSEAKVGESNEAEDKNRGMKFKSACCTDTQWVSQPPKQETGGFFPKNEIFFPENEGEPWKRYRHLGFPPFKKLACHLQQCPPLSKIRSHAEFSINTGSLNLKLRVVHQKRLDLWGKPPTWNKETKGNQRN